MKRFFTVAMISLGMAGSLCQAQPCYDNCAPVQCGPVCSPCGSSCGPCGDCCDGRFDGFYIGANVGWAIHDRVWVDRDAWVDDFTSDWAIGSVYGAEDGVIVGGQIGYNSQCGCALWGLEFDADWANVYRTKTFSPTEAGVTTLTLRQRFNWFGTLRARAGIVANDLLVYVTGGAAFAHFNHRWSITDDTLLTTETFRSNRTRWGLAFGSGIEWGFCDCFSLKFEGLYFKFPEYTRRVFSTAGAQNVGFDLIDSVWLARVGINFKLCSLFNCCCW